MRFDSSAGYSSYTRQRLNAPTPEEDTDKVLRENLGLFDEAIVKLREQRIVD